MTNHIINNTLKILNHIGFFDIYAIIRERITHSQVAILMYHRVSPMNDNWSLAPLSPEYFERQIDYFASNYEIISLDSLANIILKGNPLPAKAVVITFDDGYRDNYMYAYPTLKKYKVPATIFVTTGHIGSDELFWWDKVGYIIEHSKKIRLDLDKLWSYSIQSKKEKSETQNDIIKKLKIVSEEEKNNIIKKLKDVSGVDIPPGLANNMILSWEDIKEMSDYGITFGAHTISHPILNHIPIEQAQLEITQSKNEIENHIDKKVVLFSYPNGDYSEEIVDCVRKTGCICAVTTGPPKLIKLDQDIFKLPRIENITNQSGFKAAFSGFANDLNLIKKRFNKT